MFPVIKVSPTNIVPVFIIREWVGQVERDEALQGHTTSINTKM